MRRKAAIASMALGILLVIGAASLLLYNQWDDDRAAQAASQAAQALLERINDIPATSTPNAWEPEEILPADAEVLNDAKKEMPVIELEGHSYIGVVDIPLFDLSLPVMETWSYDKLKISPCRYTGSIYEDNLVIMAHNYKRHFRNISSLTNGEPIIFRDADGVEYRYVVVLIETVNSNNLQGMIETEYDLTLFTCTYGGQARVAVRCMADT